MSKRKSNNIRVGLTGSYLYENHREIKDTIFKLEQTFGAQLEILSRGNRLGADKYVKKFALEFGILYWEFTYEYSSKYNIKNVHTKHHAGTRIIRDKVMSNYIDYLIIFSDGDNGKMNDYTTLIDYTTKLNKKVIIL